MRKYVPFILMLLLSAGFATSCKLVFEPADAAINRLLHDLSRGDDRVAKEMCPDPKLLAKVRPLRSIFNRPFYKNRSGYWRVTMIELDKDNDMYYTYVELDYSGSNNRVNTVTLIFNMQRHKLRWTIYQVKNLDNFVRMAEYRN